MRHLRVVSICLVMLLLSSPMAFAYERWMYENQPLIRGPYVPFEVDPAVAAGLRNLDGGLVITPESDPIAALTASVTTWSSISTSSVLMNLTVTPSMADSEDGLNVFTFEDTPSNRSVVDSAIAVTVVMFDPTTGLIGDSDILFSPLMTFSTTPTEGAFDIESVATHELGHTIASGHSALPSATMFWAGNTVDTFPRILSADDVAYASFVFPKNLTTIGTIQGKVTTPADRALSRALVVAVDATNGAVISVSPDFYGNYVMGGLPPGSYYLFVEPIAPWLTAQLTNDPFLTPDWQATFFPSGGAPQTVSVTGGHTTQADITIPNGQSQANVDLSGVSAVGAENQLLMLLPSGGSILVGFWGHGFSPTLTDSDVWILGPGITVAPGSVRVYPATDVYPYDVATMVLNVTSRRDWAEAVIALRTNGVIAPYTGVRIMPAGPTFVPAGVENGAGFAPPGVAPGELVVIFGNGLGPATPVQGDFGTDGRMPTTLGGTTVSFGGVAAPLFWSESGEVDAQVPYEIAGHASARVRIQTGSGSNEVILPVVAASPAILGSASRPSIANPDGSANDRSNPVDPGSTIVAWGTGQGVVAPAVATGAAAPFSPLSLIPDVLASIGGVPATIEFAGLAPGYVGLMQLNIQVPYGTAGGPQPLVVTINGVASVKSTNVFVRPGIPLNGACITCW
jgi:uncharacterized protein (TIGR03437 family)